MDYTLLSGHGHPTELLERSVGEAYCGMCPLPKSARYYCFECLIFMCENCYKLPREIFHWLHPQHPLRINKREERGMCEGCNYVFWSKMTYECKTCCFGLCVECCTTKISRRMLQWENKKIFHYSHVHELTRCRFREEDKDRCNICELLLWGIGFACGKCAHFVHESCIYTPQIIQYPFHSLHPLKYLDLTILDYTKKCKLCRGDSSREKFGERSHLFGCTECNYYLHFRCADSLLRPIKLEYHIHNIFFVPSMSTWGFIRCHICGKFVDRWSDCHFHCEQCDEAFHSNCVPIPRSFKHKHHQHILILKGPFDKNLSEHYCDICEARRDPNNHVYCCEQCRFFGHIECVLSKEDDFPKFLSSLWSRKLKKDEPAIHLDRSRQKQIQYATHDHPLSLENFTGQLCHICKLEINGLGFKCSTCRRPFRVHEKCAALPENLDHPLHPNHMLSLFRRYPEYSRKGEFICDICREISKEFNYFCRTCGFIIDIKCALLTEVAQPFDDKGWEKTLNHIAHDHKLTLANARRLNYLQCRICDELVLGLVYRCSLWSCSVSYHTTCLDWPAMIQQHPLHPQHRFKLISISYPKPWCFACGNAIRVLGYQCENFSLKCTMAFHLECAHSLARLLKHNGHYLYYFHKQPSKGLVQASRKVRKCTLCDGETESSFCRCMKCKLHFHLGCLHLPTTAKHRLHLHRLIFEYSVDFGGCYCDICEEPRDFQHPVYCCKECELVSCINCIVSEENASSVILEDIKSDEVKIPAYCSGSMEQSD